MTASAPPPLPYPGPDVDRGPRVAATYIIGCSIATVFVILRLYSRVSIGAIGADDWCMLATATANIPLTVLTSLLALNGGTRHFYYLLQDPGKAMFVTKLNWLTQAFAVFCMSVGKIAIALLIIRLLDRASRWRKWFLYFSSAWLMINCLLMITINFAQCKDVRALWNPVIKATTRCWDPSIQENFALYAGSINTAMDFFLAILPVTIVWNLKLNTLKRIGLVVLLGCGIITGIASAVKTSMLSTLSSRADITWETYSLFIWTGVEIALIIVCGCVPPLRALYTKYRGPQTTKVSSYYANSGLNGTSLSKPAYIKQTDAEGNYPLVSYPSAINSSSSADSGAGFAKGEKLGQEQIRVTRMLETSWNSSQER